MKAGRKPNKHLKKLIIDLEKKGYNSSEIAELINKTRQAVEYHLRVIHKPTLAKELKQGKIKE